MTVSAGEGPQTKTFRCSQKFEYYDKVHKH